jgi:hypothetical protein
MPNLGDLQAYIQGRPLSLPGSGKAKGHAGKGLERAIRNKLTRAVDAGHIQNSPQEILKYVRCFREPNLDRKMAADLGSRQLLSDSFVVSGGQKNQARSTEHEHFARDDGAWFDFSITGREVAGAVELLAYDFEIRLPPGRGTAFVRFDCNLPAHHNDQRGLRCHLHCGSDDILLPAPLFTPEELLTIFIEGFRTDDPGRKARRVTDYEINWLQQTLKDARV